MTQYLSSIRMSGTNTLTKECRVPYLKHVLQNKIASSTYIALKDFRKNLIHNISGNIFINQSIKVFLPKLHLYFLQNGQVLFNLKSIVQIDHLSHLKFSVFIYFSIL